jgi:AraC-like DNA-binding protein
MAWAFLYIAGAIQGIFLAGLLFATRHERWSGNVFLGALSLIASALLGLFSARILLGNNIPAFLFWPLTATPALMGPCLLFYVKSVTFGTRKLNIKDTLHLFPFLVVLLAFLPETLTPPYQGLVQLDDPDTMNKTMLLAYFKALQLLGYLAYVLHLLNQERSKQSFESSARKFLFAAIGLFMLNSLIGIILGTLYWFADITFILADRFELAFMGVFTYLLAFYVFYYNVRPLQPKFRYLSPALTESVRDELAIHLNDYMTLQQPFMDDKFNATKTAEHLEISEHHLSEVLALALNTNFQTFTNQHRLKRFEQLICTDEFGNNSLIDIAFAAGFNSKSSFHRIVKEVTGLTPGAYKKQLLAK